ncbi:hypothetical protein BDP27DRAFT_1365567 [Rhodocollybia butyracea]|uniref:Uncharacterized protein n=1 Tax=Rhodocollybia butyracea TaxID=206335 RepID=A0A9P5PNM0_9AGAR|nr:hypothetical protein BDP27DRAFT_1365567 [Rhodocollybia butyracea]
MARKVRTRFEPEPEPPNPNLGFRKSDGKRHTSPIVHNSYLYWSKGIPFAGYETTMTPNALEVLKNGLVKLKKQVQQRKDGLLGAKLAKKEKISTTPKTQFLMPRKLSKRPLMLFKRPTLSVPVVVKLFRLRQSCKGISMRWMSPLHASLRIFWLHSDKRHAWNSRSMILKKAYSLIMHTFGWAPRVHTVHSSFLHDDAFLGRSMRTLKFKFMVISLLNRALGIF